MYVFKAMKYQLIACCKVTKRVPKSLTSYKATTIQIEAISAHKRKPR
ncbi:hypothetical protein HMPREF1869_01464 [Bacteroidales bacterium KA00251]|nr:hypothetical protein HMPREF1869_01464 [Bacteroidales bacterium KA00251]